MAISLDHINIRTDDISAVKETLVRLLLLEEGFRPSFATEGVWLYGGMAPIVHLSRGENKGGEDTGALDHIAFKDDDYEGLKARLEHHHVDYIDRTVPETGVRQVFFTVNHQIKIEVDFDPEL